MDIERLKQKILDLAIRGKLVPQDPNDESAIELVERIRKEKEKLAKEGKIKLSKNDSFIFKGSDNCYYEKIGNEIKNITEEIPFDIPDNWCWIRLNELGLFKKGPFGSSLTKEMFVPESTQGRIKVYEQKNAIQKDHLLGRYYISNQKFLEMKGFQVEPNDIIVSCAGTIGEIYVLPQNAEIGIINQALMRIKLYDYSILDYFLLYFDFVLKKEANEKGNGTGMKNIPPFDILKKMLIPLPPQNEMLKIINKINQLNLFVGKISDNQLRLKKLIDLTKVKILDYYFGENSCYKSYYSTIKPLSELSETITKGSTPTTYGYSFLKEGINFIKVENVKNYAIDHATITCFISNECHEFQKRSQLKTNDILISIAGTIGRIGVVKKCDVPANTNQAFAIVSGYDKNIVPEYLKYYLVWYINSKSNSLGHGGGMLNLTLTEIKNIQIKLPDNFQIQHKIVNKIDAILNTLNSINF